MTQEAETVNSFDRYYVCDFCAHTWSEPAPPIACERCRRPGHLSEFVTLDDAERYSQAVIDFNAPESAT